MKIVNNDYGFSFDVPEGYQEVNKEEFKKMGIEASTLHLFTKMEGKVPKSISMNRDAECETEDEYLDLIQLNVTNMQKMGMEVLNRSFITAENGRRIDKVTTYFKNLKFCTYFTKVKGMLIGASIIINTERDKNEVELYSVFASIKEI